LETRFGEVHFFKKDRAVSMAMVLMLDSIGTPIRWAGVHKAMGYYASGKVIYELGESRFELHGGQCRETGERSLISSSSIVMIRGRHQMPHKADRVALTKQSLFSRDRNLCAYCGGLYKEEQLTVEHIQPTSRKGATTWMNVVTACRSCNVRKSNRTPEEAHMPLLYAPYIPNRFEGFILRNRRILVDQMQFLLASVPRHSRLL
jgi:5-methylcytosine-specific restriction endonuclease McrA